MSLNKGSSSGCTREQDTDAQFNEGDTIIAYNDRDYCCTEDNVEYHCGPLSNREHDSRDEGRIRAFQSGRNLPDDLHQGIRGMMHEQRR
jgi:hypothetical protein